MTWSRFDEAYTDHPKIVAAGVHGELLDARAIIYCNRWGTDGHVPSDALAVLGRGIPAARRVAAKLVEVGRWERADEGWEVHDFLDYNPSRAEVEAKRQARAEAGRKGGHAKANAKQVLDESSGKSAAKSKPGPGSPTDVLQGQPQFRSEWGARWRPSEASIEWARASGYTEAQLRRQIGRFVATNLTKRTKFHDVEKAWRSWMRKEQPEATDVDMPMLAVTQPCGLCGAGLQPGLSGELECSAGCEAVVIDLAATEVSAR